MLIFKTGVTIILVSVCLAIDQDIIEYNDDDFFTNIGEHETALVMFYAPWCGHCKKLKPEYAKAAEVLTKSDPPVILVKVDCSQDGREVCVQFGVGGYPTLKIFRNGKMAQEYNGARNALSIINYMKKMGGPSSKEFNDSIALQEYLDSVTDVSTVGFFRDNTNLKNVFLEVAEKLREKVRFAHTSAKDILNMYNTENDIILFRPQHLRNKFEVGNVKYSGNVSFNEINQFILTNSHGLVGLRTEVNREDFKLPYIIAYYDVDYKKNPKGTNYWRNRILKVAKQYEGKITFVISSLDELKESEHLPYKGKPLVFARDKGSVKYKMENDFTVDALEEFVDKFLNGKLQNYIRSENIPESNNEPVKVVVAKNFDEIVFNNGRDTLIEFYSPWCGHCEKLAPTYKALAEKLKSEDVTIAKMDATKNDVPKLFKLDGYPGIYWLPKNGKHSPIQYKGGRELNDFIQYIAKHATEELKGYDRKGKPKIKTEL